MDRPADPTATTAVDRIVTADWVVTVDAADTVIDDGAVAVLDGRIVGVGPRTEVLDRFTSSDVVHLGPHALVPGLVNAHTHLAMTMFRGLADDLDLGDFLARLLPAERRVVTADTVRAATIAASLESICGGVTTALDMYYFPDAALAAGRQVGLRVLTGPTLLDQPGPDAVAGSDQMERAAKWLAEHPSTPGWRPVLGPHSTYLASPALLEQVRDLAASTGALVQTHAAETRHEVDEVSRSHGRRPVELLDDLGLLAPGTVLAHGVHLDDAEIERIAATGASIAHCPASNLKLAAGIAPLPTLCRASATVAIGTDGAASSNDLDMFTAMRLTALVHKGAEWDPTALPANTVLRMATMGGATALGLDDVLGSIEVGKQADLTAVDLDRAHTLPVYDPVSTLVYAAGRADVTHVWVDGAPVLTGGEPVLVDRRSALDGLGQLRHAVLDATR